MIYLILSIVFSSSLFVIFKYFSVFKINTLQAIVANYFVAFSLGMLSSQRIGDLHTIHRQPWGLGAFILGLLFISIFFVMAKTSQDNGVSVASVASKMSVVVPVVFGIVLYQESLTFFKVSGILIALIAVYLSSVKKEYDTGSKNILMPVILFFGSGIIDTSLKFIERSYVSPEDVDFFSGSLFGFAALFGLIVLSVKRVINKEKLQLKNVIAGIVLGIPNYYSIVFLIKALQNDTMESSSIFTLNNVGIVLLSTILSFFIFKENLSFRNKIGISLAILGIILVSMS